MEPTKNFKKRDEGDKEKEKQKHRDFMGFQ
jgi:hypothetical protein